MSDDADVFRQVKCLYIRGNIISRKFSNCSINVKLVVFKTYCSCLYTSQLRGTCLSRTTMCKTRPAGRVRPATRFCPAREMFLSYNGNRPAASHQPPLHYTNNYGIESLGCLPLHRLKTNVINNVRFFDNALLNA